ncbi:hypothetical protein [Mesorhizobium sp. M0488]|uniref:hypothetical protein n=1 Tax=unclassified Mesorhizobium TaxID=325217 RepID=UPI00333AB983
MKKTLEPAETPANWDAEALFSKAQRYVEKMQAEESTTWEHALWSSLALEFLARAALANVSPALLADVSERNWSSLFHSLGFSPKDKQFSAKSITTSAVLQRLGEILPEFDSEVEKLCKSQVAQRNKELHSGDTPFDGLSAASWHAGFYKAAKILLASMGVELKELLGAEMAATAEKIIAAAADEKAKAVKGDVAKHAKAWGDKDKEEREKLSRAAEVWATKQAGHRVACPACGSQALVYGEPIAAPTQELKDDTIIEKQEYLPAQFECIACELKVGGYSKLSVIGLGDRFIHTEFHDAADYYAPQDEHYGYEEDNNERF